MAPQLPKQKLPSQNVPTVPIALVALLFLSFGFFGLLSVILPGAGMMGLAFLVLFVFFWVQYVIWGKWLYGYAVRQEERAEKAQNAKLEAENGAGPAAEEDR